MPKWHSYVTRFVLLAAVCVLGTSMLLFFFSTALFNQVSHTAVENALKSTLTAGEKLLHDYASGQIDDDLLRERANPVFNSSGEFVLLVDTYGRVITYTDSAVPFLANDTVSSFISKLRSSTDVMVTGFEHEGRTALIAGRGTQDGFVLAGTTLLSSLWANTTFQQRLLTLVTLSVLVILILSFVATKRMGRPTRILADAASRMIDGEQVLLPDNMHGEMSEIAQAFNHMSRTVAQAFQELRLEKETMQRVLESLSEGIYAVNQYGEVLHENPAAMRLLGGVDTPAAREVRQALDQILHSSREADALPIITGQVEQQGRTLEYIVTPLPEMQGRSSGASALIRDITEQERLERTRHDYVANISHELRTPLASMRGIAEGLRDGLVTDEQDQLRYHNMIVEEVTRLSRLVNDLLELSGLQSNPNAFEMEKVDPGDLIWSLHDLNASLFEEKGLQFTFSLPECELPIIWSNEDRLNQVLTIFLDNARKYTPEGGCVELGAQRVEGGVRFYVRDNGIGMDEETCRHAFDRFHQAEKSHSGKGSGLGLAIAKEIMQKLGVEITLHSELGQGSEFSFLIGDSSSPNP